MLQAESTFPGLLFELVTGLMKKADLTINMTESLLILQGNMAEFEG